MGDQTGQAVSGALCYIPYEEFVRIRALRSDPVWRASTFADMCRLNALYMIARAGSGHIGSSFSSLDVVSWLLLEAMAPADVYFSSKGHDAPGYYAALLGLGRLPFDMLHQLRRIGGLPGHPDVGTPGIAANTGSLGMGVSKAKGMVFANRLAGRPGRVFVMTGDGELQEGQFWESLVSAANQRCHEITVIIDHNKLQSDTWVKTVSDLGDVEAKLTAFGWRVERCDGHDIDAFAGTLARLRDERERPTAVIADTIKGRGVSFMEHTALDSDVAMYRFHSGAPDADSYQRAVKEIVARLDARLGARGADTLSVERLASPSGFAPAAGAQRLIAAYSVALIEQAEQNPRLVALDADLVLDTGLIPFRDRFPERFFECGIAEQDMVSMAGGMARKGLLPVVHSFACFLSARANEQIYNNATEKTRIVYVGSLAGLVPGGPGHSHQAVRDISALAAIPGLTVVEPCCEEEVGMLLDWCINHNEGSSYLRLVSIPCEVPYRLSRSYRPEPGRGVTLTEGDHAVLVGYGPVLLDAAVLAAQKLRAAHGLSVKVINLPWLNRIDAAWLADALRGYGVVFCMDNHYAVGGQGDRVAAAIATHGATRARVVRLAVDDIPACGANAEVLTAHGLDADHIAMRVAQAVRDEARKEVP